MSHMTLKERIEIERQLSDLFRRMNTLDHLRQPENMPTWAALDEERDALEKKLAEDDI